MAQARQYRARLRDSLSESCASLEGLVEHRRFVGETVSLCEWHCRGVEAHGPHEEWCNAYEVVIPRRGAFMREVEGQRVFADPGAASFFHPQETYRVRHPVPGGDSGSIFRLSAGTAAELIGEHDPRVAELQRPRFPSFLTAIDGRTYLLHRRAMAAMDDASVVPIEVEERALQFLRKVVAAVYARVGGRRGGLRETGNRYAAEYADRVRQVIATRYREPLTLAEVGRAVDCSPFHLSRLVTAATGVPIHRMIVRRRLRDALEWLLETRESVSFIAHAVGFGSHSRLTEAFRREYGMPPSAVRRSLSAPPGGSALPASRGSVRRRLQERP